METNTPPAKSEVYGWAIEWGSNHHGKPHVSVLLVSQGHDEPGADKCAAERRGIKRTLITDRRRDG